MSLQCSNDLPLLARLFDRRTAVVKHGFADDDTQRIQEESMARVAVVTGGTRGIGAAISKALKAAGYSVAASYAGRDEEAQKFSAETGIKGYKCDASPYAPPLATLLPSAPNPHPS